MTTAVDITESRLETEESFRATAYRDTQGKLTIGYGFNISAGISRGSAAALLREQLSELDEQLGRLPWYSGLDGARQSVCLDIAFNAGLHGLLGFPHMISALASKDWPVAAQECAVREPELSGRYAALAKIILTGSTT